MRSPEPESESLRAQVERRSGVALVYLRTLPRWLVPLTVLAVAAGGVLAPPPVGGLLLLLVAALIGWLAYLSWPVQDPAGRALRLAVLALVLVVAVTRLG